MSKLKFALPLFLMFVFLTGYTIGPFDKYTNKAAGFEIDMPKGQTPKYNSQTVKTDAGDLILHTFIVGNNDAAFMVAYSDFPDKLLKSKGVDKLLSDTIGGAKNSMKATLESEKTITIPGANVKEVIFNGADMSSRARYYLVKNRMYQMVFITAKMDTIKQNEATLTKFFDSFKLIK